MLDTLFVGIDVGKKQNVVRFTDSEGDTLTLFKVSNNYDGATKILDRLKDTILHTDFSIL